MAYIESQRVDETTYLCYFHISLVESCTCMELDTQCVLHTVPMYLDPSEKIGVLYNVGGKKEFFSSSGKKKFRLVRMDGWVRNVIYGYPDR